MEIGDSGYLPDSVIAVGSLESAISCAQDEKALMYNGMGSEWKVKGNIRKDRQYTVWCEDSHRWNITVYSEQIDSDLDKESWLEDYQY